VVKTLLVALDGSELAETSLPWATWLAGARGFSLLLVRVVPWRPVPTSSIAIGYLHPEVLEQAVAAEQESATDYLSRVRQRMVGEGLDVEIAVRGGEPAESLLDLADERGAYAVVMATHGRGGLRRLVFGSVAERLLHSATVPLLLVRAGSAQSPPAPAVNRLLVPLDGSPLAERALEVAGEIAPEGARLDLVQVEEPVAKMVDLGQGAVPLADEQATRQAVAAAEEYLNRVAQQRDKGRNPVTTGVRVGDVAEEILTAARDQAADLIVMATHGHTGPARWFLGSVADWVVRRSERPVLLVSARAVAARAVGPFTVGDVMTSDLTTVREDEPLITVARKLLRRRVSGAPVVNSTGELVGVISEGDLLEWQAHLVETLAGDSGLDPSEHARRLETATASQVMSHPATTIDESANLNTAINLFRQHPIGRLPVTRHDQLVGIVTRSDELKAMAGLWQSAGGPAP
jgi:nucleotide-binding universal stress UspA family protein/predicted transcriptional regulator